METPNLVKSGLVELSTDEIAEVSGGVIFLAPVVMKIAAWGLGAAVGAGLVVGVKHLLEA